MLTLEMMSGRRRLCVRLEFLCSLLSDADWDPSDLVKESGELRACKQ
jgi:hypothetical protein